MKSITKRSLRKTLIWVGSVLILAIIALLSQGCAKIPNSKLVKPIVITKPIEIIESAPKTPEVHSGEYTIFQTHFNGHCNTQYVQSWYLQNNILWYTPKDSTKEMPMVMGENVFIEIGFVPESEWQYYGRFDIYLD